MKQPYDRTQAYAVLVLGVLMFALAVIGMCGGIH